MKKRFNRDTKIVISAIAVLIIMIFVFNFSQNSLITGKTTIEPKARCFSTDSKYGCKTYWDWLIIPESKANIIQFYSTNRAITFDYIDIYTKELPDKRKITISKTVPVGQPYKFNLGGMYTITKIGVSGYVNVKKNPRSSGGIKLIEELFQGKCSDSDNGKNYYIKGKTIVNNKIWTDMCIGATQGQEGYCDPTSLTGMRTIAFSCSGKCEDGACIVKSESCSDGTIYGKCSINKPRYCNFGDLIDDCQKCGCPSEYICSKNMGCEYNGLSCIGPSEINPYKKETTIGYDYNNPFMGIKTFTDSCFNSIMKMGYTCQVIGAEVYAIRTSHFCVTGCNEGVCVEPEPQCTDTDITSEYPDGKNPFLAGKATGIGVEVSNNVVKPIQKTLSDVCSSDGTKLDERFCSHGSILDVWPKINCPCENGVCKCYDSDGGDKIYKKGKISDGTNSFEDTCISNTKLKEYYCDGAQINSKENNCEVGCENGQCVRPNLCKEVIPGHNNLNEERMNFVFVGLNYENSIIFKKLLEMLIDYNGEYYGFYSLEPFKSNKKKINFWYVDKIGTVPKTSSSLDKSNVVNDLLEYCKLKNREHMTLLNYGYSPSAHKMGVPAGSEIIEDFNEYKRFHRKSLILFAHEMGHHFFESGEDYVWTNDPNRAPSPNYKSPPNCFVGTKEECESPANTNWYDLIGDGCGSDNIIDCKEDDPNYNAEIGCFEGCGSDYPKGIFRSTRATLMYICNEQPGSKTLGEISNCAFTYGLFNERRICKRLKEITGNVGGYCTTKFGMS